MGSVRNDLKTLTVDGVTPTQLNSAGGRIFISNQSDLKEGGSISSAVVSLRTFGPWLQPDGGAISSTEGTSATLQPDAGHEYVVTGVSIANGTGSGIACVVNLFDGANSVQIASGSAAGSGATTTYSLPYPITLTNTLYMVCSGGGTVTFNIAYHTAVRGA